MSFRAKISLRHSPRVLPRHLRFAPLALAHLVALLLLTCLPGQRVPFYEPVVTFEGYYNDDWLELPGHAGMPNTCTINGDTVFVTCYSDSFDNADISRRDGYRLWIKINPFTIDTLEDFTTEHVLVRFSDYGVNLNQVTYVAYPADTMVGAGLGVSGIIDRFERRRGGRIEIRGIRIPMHLENHVPVDANIKDGKISGIIQ
jgi:hypothetical protein